MNTAAIKKRLRKLSDALPARVEPVDYRLARLFVDCYGSVSDRCGDRQIARRASVIGMRDVVELGDDVPLEADALIARARATADDPAIRREWGRLVAGSTVAIMEQLLREPS